MFEPSIPKRSVPELHPGAIPFQREMKNTAIPASGTAVFSFECAYRGGFPFSVSVMFRQLGGSPRSRASNISGNAISIKSRKPCLPMRKAAAILYTIRSVRSKVSPLPLSFLNIREIMASVIPDAVARSFCVQLYFARYGLTALTKSVVLPSLTVGLCFGLRLAKAVPEDLGI